MKTRRLRMVSLVLVLVLAFSCLLMPVASADTEENDVTLPDAEVITDTQDTADKTNLVDYYTYTDSIGSTAYAESDIVIDAQAFTAQTNGVAEIVGDHNGETGCINFGLHAGEVTYTLNIEKDGVYSILFKYLPTSKNTNDIQVGVKVDGKYLYEGIQKLVLHREYMDDGEPQNVNGNEITPDQIESGNFVENYAVDPVGAVSEPYKIALTAGQHTLSVVSIQETMILSKVVLKVPEQPKKYADLVNEYNANGYTKYDGTPVIVEGEDAKFKSGNHLIAKADNSSCNITPHDPVNSLINYIGNTNWQTSGDTITWVIDIPADGLYTLGFNYKQSGIQDGYSYRWLKIDGLTPFEEAKNLRFEYCTSWKEYVFSDDNGSAYQFYLTKGQHKLSLSVTLGEMSDSYRQLKNFVERIGGMYIKIVMITGTTPDPDRSYELFKQIPGFQDSLKETYEGLDKLAADLAAISGKRSSQYIAAVNNASRTIKKMYDEPYYAHQYIKEYYTCYTTMSSWLHEMMVMPLHLDQIQVCAPDTGFVSSRPSFGYAFIFECKRFIASFSEEFDTIAAADGAGDNGTITLWVNWGRDQAMVLSNMIRDDFSAKTGINVNLRIVAASLTNGLLAGNFPDLQLHLARTQPVNYALRGALYDLTNFPEYEEILKRFQPSAAIPYWYNGGLYALPDTQTFYLMFYRTDVFDQLGLEPPKTWDQFLDHASIIQRNNMKVYIPYAKTTSGIGENNIFTSLAAQHNVELYNKEQNATTFKSGDVISVFTEWTDFYTEYGIEKQLDFYNRFRTGDVPLGIAAYPIYTQLKDAAPEIEGRWAIAEVPGVVQEDGTINNTVSASGTGCGILQASENKKQAWEFLKWWTSADVQYNYSNSVETIIGTVSRTATANIEAFNMLSWNAGDLEILNSQWNKLKEYPELPGGYYVGRALDQAYWEVLNGKSNTKDAMIKWGDIANAEIIRKINEYAD